MADQGQARTRADSGVDEPIEYADSGQARTRADSGFASRVRDDGIPLCWTRGGLSVTSLAVEFRDPAWAGRGQYRALLQFIMNWNNWPDPEDRAAMLDGPPPDSLAEDEKARIAAVVHALCDRDGHPIPEWVHGIKARRRGVCLTHTLRMGYLYTRRLKRLTPVPARQHRVWLERATLAKT